MRILAVFALVLMLMIATSTFVLTNHSIVPVICVIGAMLAVCIVFSVLMFKAK